jgi:hypothetical protein
VWAVQEQCVKQSSRMSCQPLIEGVIGRGTAQRPPEWLCGAAKFFFLFL